ncbi:hypothetical protein OUZ56_030447 [Daphnia magna]|uniref:Uncharacterized protein n=1 Tax=Daphnia magna TaxID=35525 RepID=A0ABQ9ZRB7_9CRUS|nr:hypothetical protein OUZ56_030447 [Daphnia magna]
MAQSSNLSFALYRSIQNWLKGSYSVSQQAGVLEVVAQMSPMHLVNREQSLKVTLAPHLAATTPGSEVPAPNSITCFPTNPTL